MNILVTTMGASWQILPELLGFTNPDIVDLFHNHPEKKGIEKTRLQWGIVPADEIWAVSSCGSHSEASIQSVLTWYAALGPQGRPLLRIWKIQDTDALATEAECRRMSEAIHTVVCQASQWTREGTLMLSLTGGRKTMSTDLQQAAAWFGCSALIHVVDDPQKSKETDSRNWGVNTFLSPLPPGRENVFTPFCLGSFPQNPLAGFLDKTIFVLPFSEQPEPVLYSVPQDFPLTTAIENLKADAGFLWSNYTNKMLQGEVVTNFLALYSLPEERIAQLKSWKFGMDPSKEAEELLLLKNLPKAELHCHLGGVATAEELIRIALKAEPDIDLYQHLIKRQVEVWQALVETCDPVRILAGISSLKGVRSAVPEVPAALCTASFILLFKQSPRLLHQVIFGPQVVNEAFCGVEFGSYERIGDLQGSGLLSHQGCLEEACCVLAEKAIEHHVDYLEVRCSPVKYAGYGMTAHEVYKTIVQSFSAYEAKLKTSLIFTASRHGEAEQIRQHVDLAVEIMGQAEGKNREYLKGFDLAGDEQACRAAGMQTYFLPMMKQCTHFTIHAGENDCSDSIWEAVYYLSAERIGHGLTLKYNRPLMEKILDRNIALEMCPSSNFQIVGFRDNYLSSTQGRDIYPLKEYLDLGITVTVNTDNPGISDTDFTRELHRAARLTPGGLSLWEILSLVRNSFKASFASRTIKHDLLKKAEEKIIQLLHEIL